MVGLVIAGQGLLRFLIYFFVLPRYKDRIHNSVSELRLSVACFLVSAVLTGCLAFPQEILFVVLYTVRGCVARGSVACALARVERGDDCCGCAPRARPSVGAVRWQRRAPAARLPAGCLLTGSRAALLETVQDAVSASAAEALQPCVFFVCVHGFPADCGHPHFASVWVSEGIFQ